jgi:RHS repeat-associated protein
VRFTLRLILLACCLAAVGCCAVALAAGSTSTPETATAANASLSAGLIVPAMQTLEGGAQQRYAREALKLNPDQHALRLRSRSAFRGLDTARAAALARSAYPGVIGTSAYQAPPLPAGAHLDGYLGEHSERIALPGGRHELVDSLEPLSTPAASGKRVGVDLALVDRGGFYAPASPVTPVHVPKQLAEGVTLPDSGVTVTPVDARGIALHGGPGQIVGATALFANTQTDTDTVVKPLVDGFAEDALLRSAASPQRLAYRLSLPSGARAMYSRGAGVVKVIRGGIEIALVTPPSAHDADGTQVPLSQKLSGDTLVLDVKHRAGDFHYPIEVDPEYADSQMRTDEELGYWCSQSYKSWCWTSNATAFEPYHSAGLLGDTDTGAVYSAGQYGAWNYPSRGASHVRAFYSVTNAANEYPDEADNLVGILSPGGWEVADWLGYSYASTATTVCPGGNCASTSGTNGNVAIFEQYATEAASYFNSQMTAATVYVDQETGPTASFDTTDPTINGYANALRGGWVNGGEIKLTEQDPGLGIFAFSLESPGNESWSSVLAFGQHAQTHCVSDECDEETTYITSLGNLPDGYDTVQSVVSNAANMHSQTSVGVLVDKTAPSVSIAGLTEGQTIGDGSYHVEVTGSDGTAPTLSSGITSLRLLVDGQQVASNESGCSPGPCQQATDYQLNGREFGQGQHSVTAIATDYAGNTTSKSVLVNVNEGSSVTAGPGKVNTTTGEFSLAATDVDIKSAGADLTVGRAYDSRNVASSVTSIMGPSWRASYGGMESLSLAPSGGIVFTDASGHRVIFNGMTPPAGYKTLKLTLTTDPQKGLLYKLADGSGNVTTFAQAVPFAGSTMPWVPMTQTGTAGSSATSFTFQYTGGVERPTQELAPVAAGVSCSPTLTKGCRALSFAYATSTTASSDEPAGWGDYSGHLKTVSFTAWDPGTSAMVTKVVAQYAYDPEGRLRAEWNPLISPALKMTYGYDAAGHVTAMSPPGQETWAFIYAPISGDASTGRLSTVTRSNATTPLGNGSAPQNTTLPNVSTPSPSMGTSVSVGTGIWSNSPVAFGYQWEDCLTGGTGCKPIVGATNRTYTPIASDGGYALAVQVTAVTAGGSLTVSTAATNVVPTPARESILQFGSGGSGAGQFNDPSSVAVDPAGNVWVADCLNNRVEKFSPAGALLGTYGSAGSGHGQFTSPWGIAINQSTGNVYVSDQANSRIEELSSSGAYVGEFGSSGSGNGQFGTLAGLAIDANGNVWVADFGNNRVQEFSSAGVFMKSVGAGGSGNGQFNGPVDLAVTGGQLYVADSSNNRIEVFTTAGGYVGWFGGAGTSPGSLSDPVGVAVDPVSGDLFVDDNGNSRVEQYTPAGSYVALFGSHGSGSGQFSIPIGIAADRSGALYVSDGGAERVEKWTSSAPTTEPQQAAPYVGTSSVWTMAYNVPVSGAGAPYAMGSSEVAAWAQSDPPATATAIFPPDEPPAAPAADYHRAAVYYMDSKDRTVNVAGPGGRISTTEYDTNDDQIRSLSPANRQLALEAGSGSAAKSQKLDIESTYNAEGTELLSMLGPERTVQLASGAQVQARHHTQYTYDQGSPGGAVYGLITTVTDGAQIAGQSEADVRTKTFSYSGQSNLGWTLHAPTSSTSDAGGLNLTTTTLYNASTGQVTETRKPANPAGGDAHSSQVIYYSAAANPTVPICGGHPEWANLPCQSQPAAQPTRMPNIALRTFTYSIWNEPLTTTDTNGTASRTVTDTYDAAGRPVTDAISSTTGTALPTVTTTYNPESGALATQSTTVSGVTKTVTSAYNKLGQLVSYTDADGNVSSYTYDVDGRTLTTNDGKGTQGYTYSTTTGDLSTLVDSSAGTFTANYNADGKLTSEVYPNGMTATHTYDPTGQAVGLQYVKTSNCTSNCTWFSDQVVPSIHGQWLHQASTLSTQNYTYDGAGRLTQVQDTPAGGGCSTRIYAWDSDSNRTGVTTRPDNPDLSCGTTSAHDVTHHYTYDEADRLADANVTYNEFGDVKVLPEADSGAAQLTSTYYADDTAASETQGGLTVSYNLDPTGRVREEVTSGSSSGTVLSHYSDGGDSPSWSVDGAGNWTRYVPDIAGGVAAIAPTGHTTLLQLTNLHGDIVATCTLSVTGTGLASTSDTTEFGVPRTNNPPRYSWEGAAQRTTVLASGVMRMGARTYVPALGRFLQADPVANGSPNDYAYTFGDPVNESDLEGSSSLGWLEAMEANPPNVPAPQEQVDPYQPVPTYDDAAEPEEEEGGPGNSISGPPLAGVAGFNPVKFFKEKFNHVVNGCYIVSQPFNCGENPVGELKHDFGLAKSFVRFVKRHFGVSINGLIAATKELGTAIECLNGGYAAADEIKEAVGALEWSKPLSTALWSAAFAIGCTAEVQTHGG